MKINTTAKRSSLTRPAKKPNRHAGIANAR